MKVVHIVGGASYGGGAEKGTLNLHEGLCAIGVDSVVVHGRIDSPLTRRFGVEDSLPKRAAGALWRRWDAWRNRMYGVPRGSVFRLGWRGHELKTLFNKLRPDVVHLHWPHAAVLDFNRLPSAGAPIVWTMRDFWAFTGGCHYALGCRDFVRGCIECHYINRLNVLKPTERLARKKNALYMKLDVRFVALSPWEAQLARSSAVLQNCRVDMIPNCIDISKFAPLPKIEARRNLGLSVDGAIFAIGAQNLEDAYKGAGLFNEIINILPANRSLITFGQLRSQPFREANTRHKHFGFVRKEEQLRLIYNAADAFICTSYEETFGKTVAESLACGTPAVVYREGGMASLLTQEEGIEVAENFTAESFLQAAERVLANKCMALRGIESVKKRFNNLAAANAYRELYQDEIDRANAR